MRREFSTKIKMLRWEYAKHCCEQCGLPIAPKRPEFDHHNPDGLTGKPTFENCRVLCGPCHGVKTKKDVANIARAKRRERKHYGIKKPSRFAGSRDSKFKKRMDGTVVLRVGEPR